MRDNKVLLISSIAVHEKPLTKHHSSLISNNDNWQKLKQLEDGISKVDFGSESDKAAS